MNTTEISAEQQLLNERIEHLSQKLDETEDVYSKLLALENDKQRAIIDRSPAKVMELLDDERGLVAQATALEGNLLALRDEIGSELGDVPASGGEPITLREIAEALETPTAGTLEDKRQNILHLATRLRHASQTNFLLLKQCSTLLEEIIRAVTGEGPGCMTYAGSGAMAPANRGGNGAVGAMMDVVAGD